MNRVLVLTDTLKLFREEPRRWSPSSFVEALNSASVLRGESLLPLFDLLYEVIGPGKSLSEWQDEAHTHAEVVALLERAIALSEGRRS